MNSGVNALVREWYFNYVALIISHCSIENIYFLVYECVKEVGIYKISGTATRHMVSQTLNGTTCHKRPLEYIYKIQITLLICFK